MTAVCRRVAADERKSFPDADVQTKELSWHGFQIERVYDYPIRQNFYDVDADFLMFFVYVNGVGGVGGDGSAELDRLRDVVHNVVPDGWADVRQKLIVARRAGRII